MRNLVILILSLTMSAAAQWVELDAGKDALRDAKLPAEDRAAMQRALAGEIKSWNPSEPRDFLEEALDVRVRTANLNGDKQLEIVAQSVDQASCGSTGNCELWVMQRRGTDYVFLLKANARSYKILHSITNSYHDIELDRHGSAFESETRLYRFYGKRYVAMKCWDEIYGDADMTYSKPKIRPCNSN